MKKMMQVFSQMVVGLSVFVSVNAAHAESSQLLYRIEKIGESLAGVTGTEEQRAHHLNAIYDMLNDINLQSYPVAEIKANAKAAIENLFQDRIILRNKLIQWEQAKEKLYANRKVDTPVLSENLVNNVRRNFRILRTLEDMIGETTIDHAQLKNGEKVQTAFTVGGPNMVIYPGYASKYGNRFDFQSGDVIVMRGNRYNSAAIAKITTEDSPFSHALIVYIDEKTGERFGVEALIETGVVIHKLDHLLNEGVGRMILLRHDNPVLAHRAALAAYKRAYEINGKGSYDFSFELPKRDARNQLIDNSDAFFCSQVVRYAFDVASGGRFIPGRYLSELPQQKNSAFLKNLGATATKTISPGDFEVETRFELVAEWRDFRITRDLRLKEAVIDKMYQLMENEGYEFTSTSLIRTSAATAKELSTWPILDSIVTMIAGPIPSYMTKEIIETMMMIQFTAGPMHEVLAKADKEYSKQHPGYVMSNTQLDQALTKAIASKQIEFDYLKKK